MNNAQPHHFNDMLIKINSMKIHPVSFDLREDKAIFEQAVRDARHAGKNQ